MFLIPLFTQLVLSQPNLFFPMVFSINGSASFSGYSFFYIYFTTFFIRNFNLVFINTLITFYLVILSSVNIILLFFHTLTLRLIQHISPTFLSILFLQSFIHLIPINVSIFFSLLSLYRLKVNGITLIKWNQKLKY